MLFDEDVFDVLLPLKQAWRNGRIRTPRSFASPLLCGRAFRELLFCRSMFVFIDDRFPTSQPFLSRPAVRECTWLNVCHAPSSLRVAEVIEWLNVDSRSKERKRLHVSGNELGDSVANLVQQLKTDYTKSKSARQYVVAIWAEAYEGELGRFANKSTAEVLIISRNSSTNTVEVERKRIDDK
ncbi:hypothetical protein AAVH_13127 [Aphelenchoides avenae]|nr:hypothetical protein AAVH_13127 [Aphelenchus avenae]